MREFGMWNTTMKKQKNVKEMTDKNAQLEGSNS